MVIICKNTNILEDYLDLMASWLVHWTPDQMVQV